MGERKAKNPWPTKGQTRTGKMWVPHPNKKGWEINVMDMSERRSKAKHPSKRGGRRGFLGR